MFQNIAEKYLVLMLDARGRGIHHIFKLFSAMQLVKKTAQLTTFNGQSGGGRGGYKRREKSKTAGRNIVQSFYSFKK